MFFDVLEYLEISEFNDLNICELGNLYIRQCVHSFLKERNIPLYKTSKELFTNLGFKVISLDWNGKDGALPIDLGKIIDFNLYNKFNILINGGTAEHVYDQYNCWKNIHNLCKKDGIVISVTPLEENWVDHCLYWYNLEFFDCLSFKNNYVLLERKIVNFTEKNGFECCYIAFKKNGGEFISRTTFIKIYNAYHRRKIS